MSWEDVWRIISAAVLSAGGIGGIIVLVVKFAANKIAEHLNKKHEAKLNKELEQYKTELSKELEDYKSELDKKIEQYKTELNKKEYISKTRFDTEFKIYRDLSQTFSEAIEGVHGIIPNGEAYYPVDEEERQKYKMTLFAGFAKASYNAQSTLFANAPFISKEIYDKFNEILDLIRKQSEVYNEANFDTTLSNANGEITEEDENRTMLIDEKFDALMNEIRDYLSNLEVLEEK